MTIAASKNLLCPLCHSEECREFHQDKYREYWRCVQCHLVFVPPQFLVSRAEEKAQYDSHQNSPDDPAYRLFLSRLFDPMQERLAPGSRGLDFGSGPGPTLSVMFEEAGHTMTLYDLYYAHDELVFDKDYDFITATEVVEHINDPKRELDRLWNCLMPGGYLGIMTKLVIDRNAFSAWHYKNEPTHISFYSKDTFQWLSGQRKAKLEFFGQDVMILQKGN